MKRGHQVRSRAELHALLHRAKEERWLELALIGPLRPTSEWTDEIAESRKIFELHLALEILPIELCSLADLTSLTLYDNQIGDEGAKAIAGSLTGLTSLSLWKCQIGDEGAKAIAGSLTGLTSLDLYDNEIGDEGAKAIAGSLTGLTSLALGHNHIGDEGAKAIAGSLTGLTSLDLMNNQIGDEGATAIAGSLAGLTSLDLYDNEIGDEGAKAIAGSLTGLTSLDLYDNEIGTEGAKAVAGTLTGLTSLAMGNNEIGDEGAKAIAGSLTGLTWLDLKKNQVGDEGAKAIAGSLTGLTSLDLSENEIGDEGVKAIAGSLTGLTSLTLYDNQIGDEGAKAIAGSLTGLTLLSLWKNQIGDEGAKAIAGSLTGLTSLDLFNNQIGDEGAKAIAGSLAGLTSLDLHYNEIGVEGAKAIAGSLTDLTSLALSGNQIGDEGAKAIAGSLTGLTSLAMANNQIGDEGAKAIAGSLTGLISLDLFNNQIGDEGAKAIAGSLTGLTSLAMGYNQIGDEGAKAIAGSLTGLTSLDLKNNRVGDEGAKAIAGSLTRLTSLTLFKNQIGDEGAKAIASSLTGLTSLDLKNNQVGDEGAKAIAGSLTRLTSLALSDNEIGVDGAKALLDAWSDPSRPREPRHLNLKNNGDLSALLPKETLESLDAQAIVAANRRFREAQGPYEKHCLNELKLLVVGREAVGKTSLLRYLTEGDSCDPNQDRTAGIAQREKIEIQGWSPDHCEVRLNTWDFGGQEMMRGTHRIFLTERSLYLLVLEDRRQDDHSLHDWLKTIRNAAGESPVIVVINKSDGGKQDLRLPGVEELREDYPNIVTILRTSCQADDWAAESVAKLRREIVHIVNNDERLRHVRDELPANWLWVKDQVRARADRDFVLEHVDFVALCRKPGNHDPITDDDEQRALLRLLHDLGSVVAHGLERDAPAVQREIRLLDPNWLTEAIYKVLDKARSVDQEGEFSRAQLAEWLDPSRYPPERHEFILSMMQRQSIGLCFRLPDQHGERYLVPEALPAGRRYSHSWPNDCLRFRYVYGYLPPSLIPRFIVETHKNLTPECSRWRTGVVLSVRNCSVLVLADTDKRQIDIYVDGPRALRRASLNIVLNDLDAVHILNPEADPKPLVPLPDQSELHVSYSHLLNLEERYGSEYSFLPEDAEHEYTVGDLLEGVRRDRSRLSEHMNFARDGRRMYSETKLHTGNLGQFVAAGRPIFAETGAQVTVIEGPIGSKDDTVNIDSRGGAIEVGRRSTHGFASWRFFSVTCAGAAVLAASLLWWLPLAWRLPFAILLTVFVFAFLTAMSFDPDRRLRRWIGWTIFAGLAGNAGGSVFDFIFDTETTNASLHWEGGASLSFNVAWPIVVVVLAFLEWQRARSAADSS